MSINKYSTSQGTRWMVRFTKPDGARTKKRGFRTKAAAQAWSVKQEAAMNAGLWVDERDGTKTVGELGDAWIKRQTHLKPSSLNSLKRQWECRVKPAWEHRTIGSIKHTEVEEWIAGLTVIQPPRKDKTLPPRPPKPLAATGKRYALQILSNILSDAVRDGLIPANPCDGVKLPKKQRASKLYLTHDQLQRLASASGEYETLVLVIGYCGLRWGEAIGIRTDDVNLLRNRIVIRRNVVWVDGVAHVGTLKSDKERSVPLPSFLARMLERHMEGLRPGALLWEAPRGGYVPRPRPREGWWKRALETEGLPKGLTVHKLRHTCASLVVQSGGNVKVLQEMLGHSSAAMTLDIYADIFDEDLDNVSMRMDEAARATGLIG